MIQFVAMKRIIAGRNSSMVIISTGRRGTLLNVLFLEESNCTYLMVVVLKN